MYPPKNSFSQQPVNCDSCSLNSICLPNGLTNLELAELEKSIDKTLKLKKKEPVFKAKRVQQGIYAVKSGAIKTTIANSDGQEQVLGFHLPGDLLGFDAFNTGEHTCDAIAIEDTLLCKISMEVFDDLCDRLPGMRKELIHQVGKEITHSQKQLFSLGQQQTDERLGVFLLELSQHYQSRGFSCKEFLLPMSRQDLANYLGMAVETLSRIISRLSEQGIFKIEKRMVFIHDYSALENLAHTSCGLKT
jgi:CRP/FNR family transcriptional regulator